MVINKCKLSAVITTSSTGQSVDHRFCPTESAQSGHSITSLTAHLLLNVGLFHSCLPLDDIPLNITFTIKTSTYVLTSVSIVEHKPKGTQFELKLVLKCNKGLAVSLTKRQRSGLRSDPNPRLRSVLCDV